jgi:DNA-binding NarL/FixJ family response regulator
MNDRLRLVIIEDIAETREGLRLLLSLDKEIKVVKTYKYAEPFLKDLASGLSVHVALMDIKLPGMSGIAATALLKEKYPEINVIMLTVFEEESKIADSILAGAVGYVLKTSRPEVLVEQIKYIHFGGSPISPTIARKILNSYRKTLPAPIQNNYHITRREKEILRGILDGFTYKGIAAHTGIAESTVKKHVQNIYHKLHVRSKAEFVKKVLLEKLV